MSDLQLRKIPFAFEGVDFIWNPSNPAFSVMINQISFWIIAVEKYFCRAIRDAEPLIGDVHVLEEARQFRQQEAQHSLCHRRHVNALIDKYPGLQESLDEAVTTYDELYDRECLEFHLAYAGSLEATFTPFFKMIIDNRAVLFREGDARVASLNLWHFCEEIEHRSSALAVYDDVVGSFWYRFRKMPQATAHIRACIKAIRKGFRQYVPGVPEAAYREDALARVPRLHRLNQFYGVTQSQMPWHRPEQQALPQWSYKWFQHFERGEDMTQFYGKPVNREAA